MKRIFFILFLLLAVVACKNTVDTKLEEGKWRGEFFTETKNIPFLFDVEYTNNDSVVVHLVNGRDRFLLKGIRYSADSVTIPIEAYDAVLTGVLSGNELKGVLKKLYLQSNNEFPFVAQKTESPRFKRVEQVTNVSPTGKWDIQFVSQKGDTAFNVGIFNETNGIVTGSILQKTGDLRYLEGALTEKGFVLSAFSGLTPYLIEIEFTDADTFTGTFYTPISSVKLVGQRNAKAQLGDPYLLTSLKQGSSKLDFKLRNLKGDTISLSDSKFDDKVVIISILGSWCPNCLDEMEYLSAWYKDNKERGVEIVGVAFERKDDIEYVTNALTKMAQRYNVDYEILFGGKLGSDAASKVFPQINKIMSYPTTIFVDKKGEIRKIHTGFNGPATGEFFEEFKTDFNNTVNGLLAE